MEPNPYESPKASLVTEQGVVNSPIAAKKPAKKPKYRMKSERLMRQAIMCFLGGLFITIGTYIFSSEMGCGLYILAWGPILFGPGLFLRGLSIKGTPSDEIELYNPSLTKPDDGKCPSCKTTFTSKQDYCKACGRYLRI
jgi:hypothetical protein